VALAFGVAALIGAAVFLIFWGTGRPLSIGFGIEKAGPATPGPSTPAPAPAAKSEESAIVVPHGSVLRGPLDQSEAAGAVALLTQAALVRVNRSTDQVEPWLAESWTASSDNLTYRFKLRPNVLWSNGTPLTAEDAAAAVRADISARVMGKPLMARASGPFDLAITFPNSFAAALRLLARVPITWQKANATESVGLGPFVLKKAQGSGPIFERNPHYWRTSADGKSLPYLDRLELIAPADRNQVQHFLNGELDFIETELRPEDYTALKRADREDRARLYDMGPGLGTDVLWVNMESRVQRAGPGLRTEAAGLRMDATKAEQFRLAISAAINRRAFCDTVYLASCDPVFGPVSPGYAVWYLPDMPGVGPDPQLARSMLAGIGLQDRNNDGILDDDAGHAMRFTVLVSQSSPSAARGAAVIRDQLKSVGIAMDVLAVDDATLGARRRKGEYDAIFGRFNLRDSDPALNLDFWIHPNATTDWERRINELMTKQAASTDRVERVQLFADVQKLYTEHMPEIYVAAPYTYVVTNMHLLNVKPSREAPALLWNADQLAVITPASR
jgi:peptide/nickel transport system substrate-binding protein